MNFFKNGTSIKIRKFCLANLVRLFVYEDQKLQNKSFIVSKCLFQTEEDLRKLRLWNIWSEGQGQSDFLVLPAVFQSCFLY